MRELAFWEAVDLYRQHCFEQRCTEASRPDEEHSQLGVGGIWYLRAGDTLLATVDCRTGAVQLAAATVVAERREDLLGQRLPPRVVLGSA